MKTALFGFIAGAVVLEAGTSIVVEPVKTIVLISVLAVANVFLGGSHG